MVPRPAACSEDRTAVDRLERELLAVGRDQRFDLGERRAGARRQHQFLRLVERDAAEPGQIEREIGLRRPADGPLGALAGHLQRLALGQRPLHRGLRPPWHRGA